MTRGSHTMTTTVQDQAEAYAEEVAATVRAVAVEAGLPAGEDYSTLAQIAAVALATGVNPAVWFPAFASPFRLALAG